MIPAATRVGPGRAARAMILTVFVLIFSLPLIAMVLFTLRGGIEGGLSLDHWAKLIEGATSGARAYRSLTGGIISSVVLAALTTGLILGLLVPTMVLVQLRARRLKPVLEFICILPITIPAIVLVVGLAPVYGAVARVFGAAPWTLCFVYGIVALPYAYRAVQSNLQLVDIATLAEAARSLGAGPVTVFVRVIVPSLKRGIVTASIITVAIVLGEYTIAAILGRGVLQTSLVEISQTDPFAAVIVSFLALVLAFVLLVAIGGVSGIGKRRRKKK